MSPGTNACLTPDCPDIELTVRRLEGDVDLDCAVDITDAQLTSFRYGAFFGHIIYSQDYHLEPWPTADFEIDIKDLQLVFGRATSTSQNPGPDNQLPLDASGVGQP